MGFESKKQQHSWENERAQLLVNIKETISDLHRAYTTFNRATDSELIEACIFEINSLQARYSHLLRRAKALDAACNVMVQLDSDKEHI